MQVLGWQLSIAHTLNTFCVFSKYRMFNSVFTKSTTSLHPALANRVHKLTQLVHPQLKL